MIIVDGDTEFVPTLMSRSDGSKGRAPYGVFLFPILNNTPLLFKKSGA